MVTQRRAHKSGLVKVVFSLPDTEAASVHVVGDFNDWRAVHAMRRTDHKGWRLPLELPRGREYQFRYLLDESRWINDPELERSAPNPFGGANSVLAT